MTANDKPIRVLLADDSRTMLWGLGKLIGGEFPRMAVVGAARNHTEALARAELHHPSLILLDLELDGYSSIEIIPALRQRSGGRVMIHTGLDDRRLHEDAVLFGARGVISKHAPGEQLLQAIEQVHQGRLWNVDPAVIALPGTRDARRGDFTAFGIELLSAAERQLIDELTERWHAPHAASHAIPPPARVPLWRLVALYNKLGLRNRFELALFAMAHGLAGHGG